MASAMTALGTLTLGSSQATVTFGSIPATYRDLYITIAGNLTTGATNGVMRVNGDTGSNYNRVQMSGNGSSTNSYAAAGDDAFYAIEFAGTGSSGVVQMNFMDYSQTDKHKTVLIRSNSAGNVVMASANRWGSTSAITSISITTGTNFASGTVFSIYGIVSA